jgi:hypothetical protein
VQKFFHTIIVIIIIIILNMVVMLFQVQKFFYTIIVVIILIILNVVVMSVKVHITLAPYANSHRHYQSTLARTNPHLLGIYTCTQAQPCIFNSIGF